MYSLISMIRSHCAGNTQGGSIIVPSTSCLTGLESAVWQLNFFIYLQNRLIQTSQTGGQRYSDTSHFSIPCIVFQYKFETWAPLATAERRTRRPIRPNPLIPIWKIKLARLKRRDIIVNIIKTVYLFCYISFKTGRHRQMIKPKNSYWKGKLSTVNLLAITSLA